MIEVLLLAGALLLVAACGAFVAAEFAFVTVDRATVEREAESGDRASRGVLTALRSLSTQLSGAQLGITVTNLAIGYMAEPAIAELIDGPLGSLGVPEGAVTGVALVIALLAATFVTMVLGELVPKNLAIARPLATARWIQGFIRGFTRAFSGPIGIYNAAANGILRRLGIEPQEELASARSPEELASLVRHSAEEGSLAQGTATLLQRSLAFGERHAVDVMTPRVRMRSLDAAVPVAGVIALARATGLSRFPVLDHGAEQVVGIVHVKHAVSVPAEERATTPIRDVMAKPVFVPSSLELDPLLAQLREGGLQIAIVVDEFGGVDGLVTLEDVVEEIVGEVVDEHDRRDPNIRRRADGAWVLSGLLRPDEVGSAVGVVLPEDEEYETIGGLMGMALERIPESGDVVELAVTDLEREPRQAVLTVARMDGMRVDRVTLEVHEPEPEGDKDDDEGADR